jgi:hypothetical protein
LFEGCVRHEVDGRRSSVPRHIAFTEIPDEVVVRRFRPNLGNVTEASGHPPLHVEPREFLDDHCDLRSRDELVLQADHVKADTGGAKRDFRLLMEADGRRRVESNAIPYQLGTPFIEAVLPREGARKIGTFDFEATRAIEMFVEADVVQERAQRDDLRIVTDVADLPDPYREQPRANDVIEQVRLAGVAGVVEGRTSGVSGTTTPAIVRLKIPCIVVAPSRRFRR